MLNALFGKDAQRKRALKNATSPVMQEFLSCPHPDINNDWQDSEIVSLDFETTGLDPKSDRLLSYGLVKIEHGAINLSTAKHEYIFSGRSIPESSVVIHHITDDQVSDGQPLSILLPELLDLLKGRVMLVHFARIEQGFLDAACRKIYGSPFIQPTIDTLVLAQRLLSLRNYTIRADRLRLFHLRDDYNLPRYKAHNALKDALTTAELLLALAVEISSDGHVPIKRLMS
jgi:DNA polymerase-3 subunit epsilon